MSESAEDGLDLAAVRQRFLETEEKLRELAEAAVNLKTGSVQLKRARMGVLDASKVLEETTRTFAEYLIGLAELSRRLSAVTAFVEEADPAAVLRGLEGIESRLAEVESELGGRLARAEASLAAADRASRQSLEQGIASSGGRIEKSIDSLEAALGERIVRATEAVAAVERSVEERLEGARAATLEALEEGAAAARLERRRLRRLIWLMIALELLALGGLVLHFVRGAL